MSGLRRGLGAAAAIVLAGLLVAPPTSAADGRIVGATREDDGLQVTVDVPPDAEVDLDGVTTTVQGADYDATAEQLDDTEVERTTVLAIDTSNSMRGERFDAAKQAATTFIESAPADVRIGIVSFDSDVAVELEPTTDRDAATAVVDDLGLSRRTLLYDAVIESVDLVGDDGQRSVLVLSDGADTSSTDIADVVEAVDAAGVVVDVVALEQTGDARAALTTIAGDNGEVIDSDSEALTQNFSEQAEVLSRQVAVFIDVPSDVTAGETDVVVTLPSSIGDVVATGTLPAPVAASAEADPLQSIPEAAARPSAAGTPEWLIYAGVAVFGAGLLVALVMLVPARPVAMSAAERVSSYTASAQAQGTPSAQKSGGDVALTKQASDALGEVLNRNRGLEQRIAARLEAAGSELRSSEWLLVHLGVFTAVTLFGFLLGRGALLLGLIFMVLGAFGPWLYLGLRVSRRRKAFNSALPDTLQMMASSLSAGLSLSQSIDTITREGAEPVASAFRRILVETRIGVPLEDAMDGTAARFDSQDFRWVVMAIRIQRQVGGNLAQLLETVANTMREREYMRRQVGALAAEGKLSAVVLSGLPPMFLLYVLVTQPDYAGVLLTDPRGLVILIASGLWLAVGIFWMSRLVKVEV